ncbi:MAG: hypothetical protein LQ340_004976 [Diploschistes diacapsis]|nr:MAG: hypothetical protein LQ340_004976 [Diploschistes diacapsis]
MAASYQSSWGPTDPALVAARKSFFGVSAPLDAEYWAKIYHKHDEYPVKDAIPPWHDQTRPQWERPLWSQSLRVKWYTERIQNRVDGVESTRRAPLLLPPTTLQKTTTASPQRIHIRQQSNASTDAFSPVSATFSLPAASPVHSAVSSPPDSPSSPFSSTNFGKGSTTLA